MNQLKVVLIFVIIFLLYKICNKKDVIEGHKFIFNHVQSYHPNTPAMINENAQYLSGSLPPRWRHPTPGWAKKFRNKSCEELREFFNRGGKTVGAKQRDWFTGINGWNHNRHCYPVLINSHASSTRTFKEKHPFIYRPECERKFKKAERHRNSTARAVDYLHSRYRNDPKGKNRRYPCGGGNDLISAGKRFRKSGFSKSGDRKHWYNKRRNNYINTMDNYYRNKKSYIANKCNENTNILTSGSKKNYLTCKVTPMGAPRAGENFNGRNAYKNPYTARNGIYTCKGPPKPVSFIIGEGGDYNDTYLQGIATATMGNYDHKVYKNDIVWQNPGKRYDRTTNDKVIGSKSSNACDVCIRRVGNDYKDKDALLKEIQKVEPNAEWVYPDKYDEKILISEWDSNDENIRNKAQEPFKLRCKNGFDGSLKLKKCKGPKKANEITGRKSTFADHHGTYPKGEIQNYLTIFKKCEPAPQCKRYINGFEKDNIKIKGKCEGIDGDGRACRLNMTMDGCAVNTGDCKYTKFNTPIKMSKEGYSVNESGNKINKDNFKVEVLGCKGDFREVPGVELKATPCSKNGGDYRLQGCSPDPCYFRKQDSPGSFCSDDEKAICKTECVSSNTGECSFNFNDINDISKINKLKSSLCSANVKKCIGHWEDIDDFEPHGCKDRCNMKFKGENDPYIDQKVKKWVIDQQPDTEYAKGFDKENGARKVSCKSYEPHIKVYRQMIDDGGNTYYTLIDLFAGDEIKEGDLRLGYKNIWKNKDYFKKYNVKGSQPEKTDKNTSKLRTISCTKADETMCGPINIDVGDKIKNKKIPGTVYELVNKDDESQMARLCFGWNNIRSKSVEELSKEYLEPGNSLGRLKKKCMMSQRNGPDIVAKKDDGTEFSPQECNQPGFKWVEYEDLRPNDPLFNEIKEKADPEEKKASILDLIYNSPQMKSMCSLEKYKNLVKIEGDKEIDVIPDKCNYDICSKHCDVDWKPSEVNFSILKGQLKNGGKIYDYSEGNDLNWGPCTRSDGVKCGVGLQAREAIISMPENFNLGNDGVVNSGKCFVPESPGPGGEKVEKGKLLHKNLTKYEFKKCRGDKNIKWESCNKALQDHITGGGGIEDMKEDFRYLGTSGILTTPTTEGMANMKLIEGYPNPDPVQETPAQATPAQATPAQAIPAQATPAQATPAQATPAQATPAQATPAQATPAQATPAQTTPAEEEQMNQTFNTFQNNQKSDFKNIEQNTRLEQEEIKDKYRKLSNSCSACPANWPECRDNPSWKLKPENKGKACCGSFKDNFWEENDMRIKLLESQIPEEEQKRKGVINKINKINQIQVDYVENDSYRNDQGKLMKGLNQMVILKRPEQIFRIFDEISLDIDSNESTINETMRSIPLGGSIAKIDWIIVFIIRLIYILELLNLKTIERMKVITKYIEKYPHYLKNLTNFYYIKENYSGQAYKVGYNDNISEKYNDDYNTPLKKWNLYPLQWIYGGDKKTGINSVEPDIKKRQTIVLDHAMKIIRAFYVPCMDIDRLNPMEQYIRFNISLYKYIQDNYKLLTSFHSNIISLNRETIVKDGKDCYNNVKKCGFSNDNYPDWYINHIKNCEVDIDKCIIDKDKKYSRPNSIDLEIKKWQCDLGYKGGPSEDECCRLLGDYDMGSGKCNAPFKNIQGNLSSNVLEIDKQSKIFEGKQRYLVLGNINNNNIKEFNEKLQLQLGKDREGCSKYSGSKNKDKCNNQQNCKYEENLKRCVYNPISIRGEKYNLGSASIKKEVDIKGDLWDEWIYTLENGNTSTSEDIKNFKSKILENDQWKEGNDWLPGLEPNKNNWETNVKLKNSPVTILEYGKNMKEEGIKKRYQDDFCKLWEDNADCKKLFKLQNENDVLKDKKENLINQNIQLRSFGIGEQESEENIKLKNGILVNKVKDKEARITNLNDELTTLRKRPRKCENCKPCKICKSCPDEETYKEAKGICPTCSCNSAISQASEKEILVCDQKYEKLKSELLKRNTVKFKNLTDTNEIKIKDLNTLIKSINNEILDIETNENICKQKKGVLTTKKDSYNNEYLEIVKENQRLQKEYTDEKDKSWIEKLLS